MAKKIKKTKKIKSVKLPSKVIAYLNKAGIKHDLLEHKTAYTAVDVANTMKKKLEEVTKALLVRADRDYYLVILPADHNLDFDKLRKLVSKHNQKDVKVIKIPAEQVAKDVLQIKNDAMTAFGSLYKLPVIMEKKLANLKKAVFASESFNHSVEMAVKDFIEMEKALLGSFGVKRKIKKVAVSKKKKALHKKAKKTAKKRKK
ncbi:MAG: YbaK/EbsC family protein [bacterium]|nr:YbaK/EbsC family protein [bacterium]